MDVAVDSAIMAGGRSAGRVRVTQTPIEHEGLVGVLYRPETPHPAPGIVVLPGSEGGVGSARGWAAALARLGYVTLALAYFKAKGLPSRLEQIPLEYFISGVDWLAAQSFVADDRIGLAGLSKGAEAALLVAAAHRGIRAVVAVSPTHVVWEGINRNGASGRSSWTSAGRPIDFVPFGEGKFKTLLAQHVASLRDRTIGGEAIDVERINGPVLLISGSADRVWPSSEMADRILERLAAHRFGFAHRHLRYEGAGHMFLGLPAWPRVAFAGLCVLLLNRFSGGTTRANTEARAAAWAEVDRFLAASLGSVG